MKVFVIGKDDKFLAEDLVEIDEQDEGSLQCLVRYFGEGGNAGTYCLINLGKLSIYEGWKKIRDLCNNEKLPRMSGQKPSYIYIESTYVGSCCDSIICKKTYKGSEWENPTFDVTDTEVVLKTGTIYPEVGSG
jgi:hypothetical protein